MAITHPDTTVRNAIADQVRLRFENDVGAGHCLLLNSSNAVVVDITLNDPEFGGAAASGGTINLNVSPNPSGTSNGNGPITKFQMTLADGVTVVYEGTVTATGGGGDMEITNTSPANGETVKITSHSYSAPV